ncbi:MAG: hypothetical protein K8F60_16255 [Melioribacteraceae bacterium]|nr:hypothetical protein [Melioribacteraceae bacterium]
MSNKKAKELEAIRLRKSELTELLNTNVSIQKEIELEIEDTSIKIDETKVDILIGTKTGKDLKELENKLESLHQKLKEQVNKFDIDSHKKALAILNIKEHDAIDEAKEETIANKFEELENLKKEIKPIWDSIFNRLKKLNELELEAHRLTGIDPIWINPNKRVYPLSIVNINRLVNGKREYNSYMNWSDDYKKMKEFEAIEVD